MLHLEGAQAGLSWLTVLKKRDRYREVFDNFDAAKIIHYDESKRQELATNELGEPKKEAGKPDESDKAEKPGTARGRGSGTVVHSRIG